jgi:hypothetical protein
MPKRSPHTNARKVEIDGHTFASKAEAERYLWLRDAERHGEILGLVLQPHFRFTVNGRELARGYTADFAYTELDGGREVRSVVEDVKGRTFRDWLLRRDLFRALYPHVCFRVVRKVRGKFEVEEIA